MRNRAIVERVLFSPASRRVGAASHWKTTTFIGALRTDGLTAPLVIGGPVNGAYFRAYVEQILVPTLRPGDIVMLVMA